MFDVQDRYTLLFKERYGEDKNPKLFEPDFQLWDVCEEVAPGKKKGRRLGFGSVGESDIFAAPRSSGPVQSDAATLALLEAEIARREGLEREMEELKAKSQQQEAKSQQQEAWMRRVEAQLSRWGDIGSTTCPIPPPCDLPHSSSHPY